MRIIVKDQGKVKDADIEFISGLNVIRGESGSGKSTVLRGIEGVVFNSGADEIITQGESESSFTVEYNNHIVTRKRKVGKTIYNIDGETLSTVGRMPVPDVLKAFGFKEIKSDKSYIRPNFLSQFSYPFLVNESSSKIFEYLTITSKAVNLNAVEDAVTQDINELKQNKKSKEEILTTLKQMVLSSSEIIKHKNDIQSIENQLNIFENKQSKLKSLEIIISKIDKLNCKLKEYKDKITYIENILSNINKLNIDYDKIHTITTKISNIELIIKRINLNSRNLSFIDYKIKEFENNRIEIKEDVFEKKIDTISKIESNINLYNKCLYDFNKIKQQGLQLKQDNNVIINEIEDFKQNNIPIIVLSTNEELEQSLNIERKDTISILSDSISVEK